MIFDVGRMRMDKEKKVEERRELIEIYNNLSKPLKKQLLTIARTIESTQEIIKTEKSIKRKVK